MSTNPEDNAFPSTEYYDERPVGAMHGLSKREYFAAIAMQALLSASKFEFYRPDGFWERQSPSDAELAEMAINCADALIKALDN
jgi:hypothetical protein